MELTGTELEQEIDEKVVKKLKKKEFNSIGLALLIKMLIEFVLIFIIVIIVSVFMVLQNFDGMNIESAMNFDMDAILMISSAAGVLATLASTIFVVKLWERSLKYKITIFHNTYSLKKILFFAILGMGLSSIAGYLFMGFSMLLEPIGIVFTTPEFELTSTPINNILTIITTCIAAPILEEWLCRGLIVGVLKKYGNVFAIVISALLFALLHGNFIQSIPAFFTGMVLAYVTIHSGSLIPAIAIHFINNAFAMTAGYLGTSDVAYWAFTAMEIAMMLCAAVVVWKYRNQIKLYIKENKGERISSFFKNWACIVFLVIMVAANFMFISIV